MSKLSLFYALLSAENKDIQLVYISWIIISLCKMFCNNPHVSRWNRQRVAPLSGIMQICEIFSVNDVTFCDLFLINNKEEL